MSLSKTIQGKFHIVHRTRKDNWFDNYEWFRYCEYLN